MNAGRANSSFSAEARALKGVVVPEVEGVDWRDGSAGTLDTLEDLDRFTPVLLPPPPPDDSASAAKSGASL